LSSFLTHFLKRPRATNSYDLFIGNFEHWRCSKLECFPT
jgi:hypothetical protein